LVISVLPENLIFVLTTLKLHSCCQYSCLSAVSGVDYPQRERRFEVVYDLLSVKYNSRVILKTFFDEINPLKISVYFFTFIFNLSFFLSNH
jgi:NADH dehydrogenase (ubiquinone) Fe-S protein 3